MFSTLRNRLGIALGAMLIIVLGLASLLYWGTQQTQIFLQRGHYAHAQLEAYLNLSLEAQRYFKKLADWLALGAPPSLQPGIDSPQQLQSALQQLRSLTVEELHALHDEQEKAAERKELSRVDALAALIRHITQLSTEAREHAHNGLHPKTWQTYTQALEQTIDSDFRALIDQALADERTEVVQVEQRGLALSRQLITTATVVAVAAVVLALFVGSVLFRSIKRPIESLVASTAKLARGELGYRLAVAGPAELQQLAASFNAMSAELQRQQQHLLEARTNLEHKVAERTQALHDANEKLKQLDQTRRQFFADISHELRTPLTIIRGEAEVTLRGADKTPAEYQTVLQRIVDLSQQLSRLVDDLLLLARSDSIATRTDVKTVHLDRLLEQVCEHAKTLAHSRQLEISLGVSNRGLKVRGDPQRINQMLMIFIDNACRYSQPGQTIALALEKDGSDAVIAVSDSGIGIETSELAHVFERRYRAANAKAFAPAGNGLGLPLAKSIVRAHHGSIDLSSAAHRGTTVTVRLPLSDSEIVECAF